MQWIDDALARARDADLLRQPADLVPVAPTRVRIGERELVSFCGNDYLGLRQHPRVVEHARRALEACGTGTGASRLVSGDSPIHTEAEAALADLVGAKAALLTSSGFATNAGVIPALTGAEDVVFSDALNHASIVDGCRLSRARVGIYPHRDVAALARLIERHRPFRRGWVITESLFSMDGDVAPLVELRALCDREGLHLYVDDAHAIGVCGPSGAGLLREMSVEAEVTVGTLGKALGSAGAFVAGSESLRLYLWNQCRSFVFSTAVSPANAAAATAAARLIREDPAVRASLARNIAVMRESLAAIGHGPTSDPRAPIFPIVLGENARAVETSRRLRDDGFFVQAIRPPTVPPGSARLRVTVSAAHSPDEIRGLASALARCL